VRREAARSAARTRGAADAERSEALDLDRARFGSQNSSVPATWPIGKMCREAAQIVFEGVDASIEWREWRQGAQARQLWEECDRVFTSNTGLAPEPELGSSPVEGCSRRPPDGMPGYTMPGTRPRPSFSSLVSRSAP
jgi:hypothetical protein